ncbi:MAG: ORC1-type DNA replication protein [Candidatus Woesearchaeota archaeon]
MVQKGLTGFFEQFLTKESIFNDRKVLQANYTPETIIHRDEQIHQMANILAPTLRLDKPSNLFLYGKSGTGKTLSIKYVTNQISQVAMQRMLPIKIFYINCKLKRVADTEYRLIAQLCREFGKAIPPTGLPTDEIYKIFFETVDKEKQIIILILDEIDQLVKKASDDILYNLTRINSELKKSQISLVGISNDLVFTENLDPRVKSSLSEEEIVFAPYNALQLQQILKQRAKVAFKENIVEEGVLEKCAAYAAREHGDARRALDLLRVAAEVAERNGYSKIQVQHIDEAEEKIENDRVLEVVSTQPAQQQAILYSIISIYNKRKDMIFTGEIYELYKGVCLQVGLRPLTQRRVSDVVGELDMLGMINAKVISKGRYGRTREISLAIPSSSITKIKRILEEGLDLN